MVPIRVVSVDLFNTLLDLSNGIQSLWRVFLGERFVPTLAEEAIALTTRKVVAAIDRTTASATYRSLGDLFTACFTDVFEYLQVAFDPQEATAMLICHHAQCPWFPDAIPWLDRTRRGYRLCLSSDTDEMMMGDSVREYPFDMRFTSEELGVYKGDPRNRFFRAVVEHYALPAEQILHVGDSHSEMISAQRMGLRTCWVNRNGSAWQGECLPDYEVASLEDLALDGTG